MAANSTGSIVRDSSPPLLDEFEIEDLKAFDVNHADEVQNGFLQLLELGKHSDVTFIITEEGEDHHIPAHRVILASQSEYFDRLLFGEMREAHPGAEIPLQDTPLEAFQLLMMYTYCGEMQIKDSDLQLMFDVVRLADRFGLHTLKSALGEHLGNIACCSNVLPILMHADLFQLEKAKTNCFHFLDTNAKSTLEEASKEFLSLPRKYLEDIVGRDSFVTEEIDIFQVVRKWLEHNKKTEDDSASLLKVVRLCEIPPKLLFAEVEPSGLFDKEAIFEAVKVSCKPELERMNPRGFSEPDQNLFGSKDHLVLYQYTYNESPPNWRESGTIVPLEKPPHTYSFQPGSGSRPTSICINLNGVYLVNNITLELGRLGSEYNIHVSSDNKTWRQLIDYSKTRCTRLQVLWFPKQAVRYIQFVPLRKHTVQLHSCALKSEVPVFAFRDPGVIAPLEPFTPLHLCKSAHISTDGMEGYIVSFYQPYSFSLLRMSLLRDFDEGDSIDVRVLIHDQVYDFKDQEFGQDVEVMFAERFANSFTVLAKPTDEQTKKRRKLNDNNEEHPINSVVPFKLTFVCQA